MKFYFSYVYGSKDKYNLEKIILEEGDDRSEVVIPDSYNGKPITQINDDILYDFGSELKTVVFGDNISLFPMYLFAESSGLERIYLGRKIGTIHSELEWCPNLKDVYFNGTKEEWEAMSTYGTPQRFADANCTVHFGTMYDKVQLKQGDKPLYPYTHWDCVKGIPNDIGVQADYGENDITSKRHILNREFYKVLPYNGLLNISDYSGKEVCTNIWDVEHAGWIKFVKIADLKADHKLVIKMLGSCNYNDTLFEYSEEDKEYGDNYSLIKNPLIEVVAVNNVTTLEFVLDEKNSFNFTFNEPGLYVYCDDSAEYGTWFKALFFNEYVKKIDECFLPDSLTTKKLLYNGVLNVSDYTGSEISSNVITAQNGISNKLIKVADLETDHKTVVSMIKEIRIKNGDKYSEGDNEYRITKEYADDYSACELDGGYIILAAPEPMTYKKIFDMGDGTSLEYSYELPESGLYITKLLFDALDYFYVSSITFEEFYVAKKINNEYLDIDEKPTKDSKKPVSSGGVFDMLQDFDFTGGGDTNVNVPTKLSELEEDESHRTVTDNEKKAWNEKSDFSGKYEDLDGLPEIPTTEGLATEDFVVEKVNKATTIEEIDLPENFEGYTDVINLTEPVGFDWLKLKMWSESDGLTIPESNSPYDFDFSKIKEMEKVRFCSVPAKIDLETIDRNMVSAVFIECHKNNESGIFGFQIMKLDSFFRIVMNAEGASDMYYLRQGDGMDSIANFTAPSEGWYIADTSNGTARIATDADLSFLAGEYDVKIIDWGSFCKDQAAEMGVTEISPQKVIDLCLNELISYPKGIYKSKLPISKVPEKGVDYFTEEDKTELVNSVLEALPKWEGGSY